MERLGYFNIDTWLPYRCVCVCVRLDGVQVKTESSCFYSECFIICGLVTVGDKMSPILQIKMNRLQA